MTEELFADPIRVPENLGLERRVKRVLAVMPGYAADEGSRRVGEGHLLFRGLGLIWRVLTTESYRGFVRGYRDFYANPRSSAYMAARLSELMASAFPDASLGIIAIDPPSLPAPLREHPSVELTSVATIEDLDAAIAADAEAKPSDLTLLLHYDALGLGLGAIEKRLLKLVPHATFVMNGRRRVYRLDRTMRKRLAPRRWLAETRLVELGLGHVIGLAAHIGDRKPGTA